MCSPAIFKTSFPKDKDMWIAATNMHFYKIVLFPLTAILQLTNFTASYFFAATDMHFYIIVLFPLTPILQLTNFTASYFFSLLINGVILLLNCLVLVSLVSFYTLSLHTFSFS